MADASLTRGDMVADGLAAVMYTVGHAAWNCNTWNLFISNADMHAGRVGMVAAWVTRLGSSGDAEASFLCTAYGL